MIVSKLTHNSFFQRDFKHWGTAHQDNIWIVYSWVGKIRWRRDTLPTPVFLGFPCGSAGKESTCNVGDLGLIPGLGRSPGEGKGYPFQYAGLENSMDCTVYGVAKSRTWLSDFHFQFSVFFEISLAVKKLAITYFSYVSGFWEIQYRIHMIAFL